VADPATIPVADEVETASTPDEDDAEPRPLGDVSVLAEDLHVYYRVYEDRRPRMGEVFARRFRRPGYREVRAVQGVDLVARRGESIGLIGRNGSGKSTLLQAIAGLIPATQGEVYASSQPSILGVSAALQRSVSGRRNILLGGLALGMSRAEIEERMDGIIEWSGLEDFIDLPLRTYSSGMRARLHFAISTAVGPEILLIDEALSVGDEVFKERSRERIGELLDDAGTVFVCSHSMSTIRELCTRVIWLDGGRIEMDGEPAEVIKAYKKRYKLDSKSKKRRKQKKLEQQRLEQERLERERREQEAAGEGPAGDEPAARTDGPSAGQQTTGQQSAGQQREA
jgi:teichoic acid transport system ATP-binding protein